MPRRTTSGNYGTLISKRSQRLEQIGSCITLLGVPLAIMGVIFTIVAYTSDKKIGQFETFSVVGPILVVISILCFIAGFIMFQMTEETLAHIYSYMSEGQYSTMKCCGIQCVTCNIIPYRRSRGGDSSSELPTPLQASQPRSILQNSNFGKGTHKLMANRVRFDGQSEEDIMNRDKSVSVSSLHRHCRVHPSDSGTESPDSSIEKLETVSGNIQVCSATRVNGRPASTSDIQAVVEEYAAPASSVV